MYPDGLSFISGFFGCLMSGAIAVPAYPPRVHRVLPDRSLPRLKSIFQDCKPKFALTNDNIRSKLEYLYREAPEFKKLQWFSPEKAGMIKSNQDDMIKNNPEQIAFLQYTSGSTASPKGVMVTNRNIVVNQRMIMQAFHYRRNFTIVSWVPVQHDLGLVGMIMGTVFCGGQCILMSPVAFIQKPFRWLQTVSKYKAMLTAAP